MSNYESPMDRLKRFLGPGYEISEETERILVLKFPSQVQCVYNNNTAKMILQKALDYPHPSTVKRFRDLNNLIINESIIVDNVNSKGLVFAFSSIDGAPKV